MKHLRDDELAHYGILGQKWGIRRYQNKDGTLTKAGKKRADKMKEEYTQLTGKRLIRKPSKTSDKAKENAKKRIKDLSDTELKDKIARLENEKRLAGLQADTASNSRKFISSIGKNVLAPAATEAGKKLATDLLMKIGKKALNLDDDKSEAVDEVYKELKREADIAKFKKQKIEFEEEYNKKMAERKKREEEANQPSLEDLIKEQINKDNKSKKKK